MGKLLCPKCGNRGYRLYRRIESEGSDEWVKKPDIIDCDDCGITEV